jgi:amino acid transporter
VAEVANQSAGRAYFRLMLYAALAAALPLFVAILWKSDGPFFYFLLLIVFILPLVLLTLLLFRLFLSFRLGLTPLEVGCMLIVFCAASWLMVRHSLDIRTSSRWLLRSKEYKSEVLAQPEPSNGALRHIEWDGWGFPGAGDTSVYLVYDPTNSLGSAARSGAPAQVSGIPCEVPSVRRLEDKWYTVLFYTEADWERCA